MNMWKVPAGVFLSALLCACAGGQVPRAAQQTQERNLSDVYVTRDVTPAGMEKIRHKVLAERKGKIWLHEYAPDAWADPGENCILAEEPSSVSFFDLPRELPEVFRSAPHFGGLINPNAGCRRADVSVFAKHDFRFWDCLCYLREYAEDPEETLSAYCNKRPWFNSPECAAFIRHYQAYQEKLSERGTMAVLSRFQLTKRGYSGALENMLSGNRLNQPGAPTLLPLGRLWGKRAADVVNPVWFINVVYSSRETPVAIVASKSFIAVQEASLAILKQAGVSVPGPSDEDLLFNALVTHAVPDSMYEHYPHLFGKKEWEPRMRRFLEEKTGAPLLVELD